MFTGNKIKGFLFIALIVLFLGGILELFALRFQAGDIYPAYSSFRSDPLGGKAFYESLKLIPTVTVSRNLERLDRLRPDDEQRTFLYLGMDDFKGDLLSEKVFDFFEHTAAAGGRVIISCRPQTVLEKPAKDDPDTDTDKPCRPCGDKEEKAKSPEKEDKDENKTPPAEQFLSVTQRWDIEVANETTKPEDTSAVPVTEISTRDDRPAVFWPTTLYFKQFPDDWRPVYARSGRSRSGRPVIIERKWEKGRIVLLSDSYLFSNEALKNDAPARLLAWIIGDTGRVVFDESHFGIQKTPGVAWLIRKYDLYGMVGVILLLAVLFIWKQSAVFVPLPPAGPADNRSSVETGKDNLSGLTNLLKRRYAPAEVVRLALREWENAPANRVKIGQPSTGEKLLQARAVLAEGNGQKRKTNPVAEYNAIAQILSE